MKFKIVYADELYKVQKEMNALLIDITDGNGRTGRTLLNYYLMTHNHPPLIVYDQDKKLYYECLEKYDAEETIAPLTEFLKYETEKTWEKTLERGERENRKKRLEEIR